MSDENNGSYEVFARKYRPRTFDDVLGQDHVVQTLKNAIEKDRLAHAYLFVGPRGTGKTTTARILAKALNCQGGPRIDFDPDEDTCVEIAEGRSLDVLEIDGASNRGIDHIRDLRDTVKFAPAASQFKIYYIDEVHMLTKESFNALLKTLEEPPPHVKFIFATTEADKILPTILSRCQRFDLRRIPAAIIAEHLLYIAKNEGVALSEAAAFAVAKGADGGMRDAQSMLDQLVAFCGNEIDENDVLEIFGFNSLEAIARFAGLILQQDTPKVLATIHDQSEAGRDLGKLLADLITHFRLLLVQKVDPAAETEEIAPELLATLAAQRDLIATDKLLALIDVLAEADGRMKWAPNKKLHLEIGLIRAVRSLGETSIDDVISLLSDAAAAGPPVTPAAPPASSPRQARTPASPPTTEAQVVRPAPAPVAEATPAETPPAESPAPAPAPASAPTSPAPAEGPLSGEALWQATSTELVHQRPLLESYLAAASFLDHGDRALSIGFPTGQAFFKESIQKHTEAITEALARFAGKPVELRIELRDDLEVKEPRFDDDPSEGSPPATRPEAPATSADIASAPATPSDLPSQAGTSPEGVDEAPNPEEDFYDDPLIKKALAEFEASPVNRNS